MNQVQRGPFTILEPLQDPGGNLRSAIGERDPVKLVLDHDRAFRRRLHSCALGDNTARGGLSGGSG